MTMSSLTTLVLACAPGLTLQGCGTSKSPTAPPPTPAGTNVVMQSGGRLRLLDPDRGKHRDW
jgi:hypothetical protein